MSVSKRRLKKGRQSIIDGYKRASIIREVVESRPFMEQVDSPEDYFQIGLRTPIPKDWFEETSNVVLDLGDIGRDVAIGEENFLIVKIQEEFPASEVRRIEEFTFGNAVRAIEEIKENGYSPSVLFVPIEFYVEMHNWRTPSGRMAIQYPFGPESYFVSDQLTTLKIFWSSKYTPLDKILVFDRSVAKWIVKTEPTTGEYIHVTIKDSEEPDKFDITAKTVVKFILIKPNALQILAPTRIPRTE